MQQPGRTSLVVFILVALVALPLFGQTKADQRRIALEQDVENAALALATAENVGAPIYAKELYDEAKSRLDRARSAMTNTNREKNEDAQKLAVEAYHAARAAEAKARWNGGVTEARNLRSDIVRFGGTVAAMELEDEPSMEINRGTTSKDRIQYAENAVTRAKAAGGTNVDAAGIAQAEDFIKTAKRITKADTNSDSADHLAYVAEMIARRAFYLSRGSSVIAVLPGLRLERTRRAQSASEAQANKERQERIAAEQRAAQVRAQLDAEMAKRRADQDEIARLRTQLAEREQALRGTLEEDRTRRIEAERRLDALMTQYESAVSNARNAAEVEALRRQVEDQSIALRNMQERERQSETALNAEIERLRIELENERKAGRSSSDALTERQRQIELQANELDRMRREREEAERARAELDQRHQQSINEAQKRLEAAQAESAQLREQTTQLQSQVEAERARAAQQQAELEKARAELARRDAAEQERTERMQQALSQIASTRTDERGFVVTLSGVLFDTGKATLKQGAKNTLGRIADQLRANDDVKVLVEGHTDSVGSDASNMALSEARANAVREYLASRGIAADRITTAGRGEGAPIATNDTPAGRQQNRRVELVLTQ